MKTKQSRRDAASSDRQHSRAVPPSGNGETETATPAEARRLQRTVLWMVLLNAFATPLMLSAANVALPAIAEDLAVGAVSLSWIPMAYLMASAMFVLVFGRMADMYGRRRIYLLGTGLVILTSIAAALAPSAPILIAARFLQGLSSAMLYATQMAIVTSVFPAARRGRAIGLVVATVYVGLASGPFLGGFVIDQLGWRASFLLQVPLALVVLLLGLFRVRQEWFAPHRGSFDVGGAINYSVAILLLCLGVSLLPQPGALPLIGAGLVSMGWFLHRARLKEYPLWDVRLFFNNRTFSLSCLASFIIYSATYANVVLISLYLQYLQGLSASATGAVMMIQPLVMALFSPFTGRLSDHLEPRLLASAGMLLTAGGLALLALLSSTSSLLTVVLALAVTGFGFSLFSSPNVNAIMGSVQSAHYGAASSAVATMRILGQLSSMVLVALALAVFVGQVAITPEHYPALERSISFSFFLAAGLCLPGLYFSLSRGRVHQADNRGGDS